MSTNAFSENRTSRRRMRKRKANANGKKGKPAKKAGRTKKPPQPKADGTNRRPR